MDSSSTMNDLLEGVESFCVEKCQAIDSRVDELVKEIRDTSKITKESEKIKTLMREELRESVEELRTDMMQEIANTKDDIPQMVAETLDFKVRANLVTVVTALEESMSATAEQIRNPTIDPPGLSSNPICRSAKELHASSAENMEGIENSMEGDVTASTYNPTSDKLNAKQRAFFKSFVAKNPTEPANEATAQLIIHEGITAGVWTEDFAPDAKEDFVHYLIQRIKNERKSVREKGRRQELLEEQQSRLQLLFAKKKKNNWLT